MDIFDFVNENTNRIFDLVERSDGGVMININLNAVNDLLGKISMIVIYFILMYIGIKIGNKIIDKFVERQINSKVNFSMDNQKAITLGSILKSALRYGVFIIGGVVILTRFLFSNVDAAVIGAIGFAISIGAQSLVKDLINGFFILFEDQFGVGDHITIGLFSGIVEEIGIRTTSIRDFSGDLHVITNGSILNMTNHSKGDIRFIVDVEVAYEEDIDTVIDVIEDVCIKFQKKNSDNITKGIEVLGVNSFNASGVTVRVVGKTKPLTQWKMERELRKEIKVVLDEKGIEIPYPKTQLIK